MKNEKKLCSVVLVCFVMLLTACNNIGNILTGKASRKTFVQVDHIL